MVLELENELKSPKELKAIKGHYQEHKEVQKELDQEDLRKKAEAEKLIEKRFDLLEELKEADQKLGEFRARQIDERLERTKEIQEQKESKNKELSRLSEDITEFEESFIEIKKLVEDDKDAPQDIKNQINLYSQKITELKNNANKITEEIKNLEADEVTDEELFEYQKVIKQSENLKNELEKIETNPDVIEIMVENQKTLEQKIQGVVNTALEIYGYSNNMLCTKKEDGSSINHREKFIREIVQQFMEEEIESRGLNSLKDRSKKLEELTKMCISLDIGLHSEGQKLHNIDNGENYDTKALWTGLALKNLIGKYGTSGGSEGFWSNPDNLPTQRRNLGYNQKEEYAATGKFIKNHLNTINLLFSYDLGTINMRDQIREGILGAIKGISSERGIIYNLHNMGLKKSERGAIIPVDANSAEVKRIEEFYTKSLEQKTQESETIVRYLGAELKNNVDRKVQQVSELQNTLIEIKKMSDEMDPRSFNSVKEKLNNEINSLDRQIQSLQQQKERKVQELQNAGFLSFSKGRIGREIQQLDYDIKSNQSEKDKKDTELTNLSAKHENYSELIRKYSSEAKILNAIDELKREIDRLKAGY